MQKRNRQIRRQTPNPESHIRRNDLFDFAQSFHTAAKKLAESLQSSSGPFDDAAVAPVVFMYRHALELHLKAIVLGGGGNFLPTKPDPLSIRKTSSVSWLGQFVSQVIVALGWEQEFKCDGIENLDDFKAVVEGVNSVDPGSYAFRLPGKTEASGSFNVQEFATKMDALLELLDATADALAAERDLRSGAVPEFGPDDGGFEPTIQ